MKTWHIHIEGQVQGVGFRPYVFMMARHYGLKGRVNNTVDGVHVEFGASSETAQQFYLEVVKKAPRLAQITRHQMHQKAPKTFADFQIIRSQVTGKANLLLTPDFALCGECKQELSAEKNRRKGYPFITCTNCGPRFSIIQTLPYDREMTTMKGFRMCPACAAEYENPMDRRFYSQTNSCPKCRIVLSLLNNQGELMLENSEQIIKRVAQGWEDGQIIAIKGIGGYLLTCDARNEQAVRELGKRKHRPSKPFALMYPDLTGLANEMDLREVEREELQLSYAPIVLLSPKADIPAGIAPKLNKIGVMLPYTPLYELLLQQFGRPIVATSGNLSNSPIVFEDEKAVAQLSSVADFILMNNREIVVPQDDSVVKFTALKQQRIILRRSRGLAPTYINAALKLPKETILATGAMLKSTFTFLHRGNTYISPYLGDLDHFDTLENYKHSVRHFFKIFEAKPTVVLADKHPEYASTRYAEMLAQQLEIPFEQVQHHQAHFGAVLAENNLIHTEQAILGVIWDGTGLGEDGQIWGGEFFTYEKYSFSRCAHFDYFDFMLGDKMAKEPRIAALSACWNLVGMEDFLREKFSKTEWEIYSKMLIKGSSLKTSSVGRIFDAVASLLGILDKQTYEGEAAMQLEAMAEQYFQNNGWTFDEAYVSENSYFESIPTEVIMSGIMKDLKQGKKKDFIAAKFHFTLMVLLRLMANKLKIKKIAFSGGVFQNGVLVDLIIHHLEKDFELYFQRELSPNDENVSFGQLVCYQIQKYRT